MPGLLGMAPTGHFDPEDVEKVDLLEPLSTRATYQRLDDFTDVSAQLHGDENLTLRRRLSTKIYGAISAPGHNGSPAAT